MPTTEADDIEHVTMSCAVNNDKRHVKMPMTSEGDDAEVLLKLVNDFVNAQAQPRLHLNTEP